MYRLKEATIIAYNQLISHMEPLGYYPVPFTTGPWAQKIRRKKHFLCVDDFGIRYFSKDDADHLLESLRNHYAISTDWEGYNYLILKIYRNYNEEYVDISIPEYIKSA